MASLGIGSVCQVIENKHLNRQEEGEQRYFEGSVNKTWRLISHKEQRREMTPNDCKINSN